VRTQHFRQGSIGGASNVRISHKTDNSRISQSSVAEFHRVQ
jgi:hypothetical protein